MSVNEISGTCLDTTSGSMDMFQYYRNGMLKLSEEGENLLRFLPASQQNGTNNRNLMETMGIEFERIVAAHNDIRDQLYVLTATWGLALWEEMLALPIQSDLTQDGIDRRRVLILTALARESFTSEAYFQSGIALLAGVAPTDVIITPLNRKTDRYSWRIEVPISFYEDGPTTVPTLTGDILAGSVPAGSYTYKVAFQYPSGVTAVTAESAAEVLAATGEITLTNVPIGVGSVVARLLYRKEAGDPDWLLVGSISNNSDTVFVDQAAVGTDPAPVESTAKTELALRIEEFVSETKPAHLHIDLGSVGFRADVDGAGDPV